MVASEHAARLIASIAALDRAAQDAVVAAGALSTEGAHTDASAWLPGIQQSLARIQLECTDLNFAARSLRDALPSSATLQPRLI
jgi:hypothetical protein